MEQRAGFKGIIKTEKSLSSLTEKQKREIPSQYNSRLRRGCCQVAVQYKGHDTLPWRRLCQTLGKPGTEGQTPGQAQLTVTEPRRQMETKWADNESPGLKGTGRVHETFGELIPIVVTLFRKLEWIQLCLTLREVRIPWNKATTIQSQINQRCRLYEQRCQNFQQNSSKSNSTSHQKFIGHAQVGFIFQMQGWSDICKWARRARQQDEGVKT